MSEATDQRSSSNLLTFASGGWVILATLLICIALITWAIAPAVLRTMSRPPGDGTNPETYGFDLSPLLVPRQTLTPNMLHRDMVPVLDEPTRVLTIEEARRINEEERGKYLVTTDKVVGVTIGGAARAYPISLLNVHEIIHDTLGPPGEEIPIAVTYSWLSGCARVFDRRADGETLMFGVSGLVSNANLLMYDRADLPDEAATAESAISDEAGGESLWSQILAKAVAGPAAAREATLTTIPAQLVSWAHWRELHPETTVIARDPNFIKRYRRGSPEQYFISDEMPFPAAPLPRTSLDLKARVIAVITEDARAVFPLDTIAAHARERAQRVGDAVRGQWQQPVGEAVVTFTYDATSDTVLVSADRTIEFVHALWFAWHAAYPDDPLIMP